MSTAVETAGRVIRVIGPVIDVEFPEGGLPAIYNALEVKDRGPNGETVRIVCEVQQLLGDNRVRTVAMSSTDGMTRGMKVFDLKGPISVPVGEKTLGRILNVLGEAVVFRRGSR